MGDWRMNDFVEELGHKTFREILESERINELRNCIRWKMVGEKLNKKQKRLLLQIGDAGDLKTEICSHGSFDEGFKVGLKIGYEVNA